MPSPSAGGMGGGLSLGANMMGDDDDDDEEGEGDGVLNFGQRLFGMPGLTPQQKLMALMSYLQQKPGGESCLRKG